MTNLDLGALRALVGREVRTTLFKLPPHLRAWAEAHLIEPVLILAWPEPDCRDVVEVIQVTDQVDEGESADFVVFYLGCREFGIVTKDADGSFSRLRLYGDFASTVKAVKRAGAGLDP